MPPAPLTALHLHEPVLPFVRPVPVMLRTTQTIAEAHQAVRAALAANDIPYFYVVDDGNRLAGVVAVRHLLAAQPDDPVDRVMNADVVAIPS